MSSTVYGGQRSLLQRLIHEGMKSVLLQLPAEINY